LPPNLRNYLPGKVLWQIALCKESGSVCRCFASRPNDSLPDRSNVRAAALWRQMLIAKPFFNEPSFTVTVTRARSEHHTEVMNLRSEVGSKTPGHRAH
jgi:hypothetical protein